MSAHNVERPEEDAGPEIVTQAGVSDGDMDSGEPLTGKGTEQDQEDANEFFEEVGALIQGKEVEDLHTPDMVDD